MRAWWLVLLGVVLLGCGSRTAPPPAGRAQVTVHWPARTRVVPNAAESLVVAVHGAGDAAWRFVLNRPADGTPSLLTIDALPGQTIALVGPTGAGKSTIINLLTRFYEHDEGELTIDGVPVKAISKSSLRKAQWKLALSGNTSMLIFLGKIYLGQRNEISFASSEPEVRALLERWETSTRKK